MNPITTKAEPPALRPRICPGRTASALHRELRHAAAVGQLLLLRVNPESLKMEGT